MITVIDQAASLAITPQMTRSMEGYFQSVQAHRDTQWSAERRTNVAKQGAVTTLRIHLANRTLRNRFHLSDQVSPFFEE